MTVTILSGSERRRRWTTAEKLRIVQESQARDPMVSEIARRTMFTPISYIRGAGKRGPAFWRAQTPGMALAREPALPRLRLRRKPFCRPRRRARRLAPSGPAAGVIEIEFAAGGRMRITGPVEACLVSALIETLARSKRR